MTNSSLRKKSCRWSLMYCLAMLILLGSCASIVTPTGGEKDVLPPVVVSTVPLQAATEFTSKKIVLTFDEYVQLNELDKQLIVSPILKPAPVISAKAKKITIEIEAPLQANTTYTLNFGNAIVDLRESNPIRDYRYVFSTGSFVDSMQLHGSVCMAENLKKEGGILVMLYNTLSDSMPYSSTPDFFTRTDSSGNFTIRNIGRGPYKIFALKDADGDYKLNTSDEAIGFSDQAVSGNDSLPLLIYLFKEVDKKLFIKSSKFDHKAAFTFVLNRTPGPLQFKDLGSEPSWQSIAYNFSRDTVTLWLKDTLTDSLSVEISENGQVIDTLRASRKVSKDVKLKSTPPEKLQLSLAMAGGSALFPGKPLILQTSLPLQSINEKLIALTQDSTLHIPLKISITDSIHRTLRIDAVTQEKSSYQLKLLPGALTDIYHTVNDTLTLFITTPALTEFGSIKIKLQGIQTGKYLLQLVDDKDVIKYERSIPKNGNYLLENISPAVYKIRLVKDTDNNGQFTTGNYLQHQQPERVYYFDGPVTIRANWDIEIDWSIPIN